MITEAFINLYKQQLEW